MWRKRRYVCRPCGRTFTEPHPSCRARQRVTRRFRERLLERVRGGAAHSEVAREEHTTRYQVARAFSDARAELAGAGSSARCGGCRSTRPITAAAKSWPPSSPTSTAAA